MSRIGKIPVHVPKDVKINIGTENIEVQGKNGTLRLNIPYGIQVKQQEDKLFVERSSNDKQSRANHGTVRSRLANIITGVTQGHKKELEIQGIGFRASLQGKKITFNFGLSHPVEFDIPEDVNVSVPSQTSIIVEGVDNIRVGQVAATIRSLKPVEPYKGKGVRYVGEVVRRKQGKSVSK